MEEELSPQKQKRSERKRKKLLAEFQLAKSNDEVLRPGEFFDSTKMKKYKVEETEEEGGKKLSDEEFKLLKKQLQERKKFLTQLPRFHLQLAGINASLRTEAKTRAPIFMSDVQHLILYSLCGNDYIQPPYRWCGIQKANRLSHIIILIIEGISCLEFQENEHLFPKLTSFYQDRVEVITSSSYGIDIAKDIACIPLTSKQKAAILEKYGNLEAAINSKEIFKVFHNIFPFKEAESNGSLNENSLKSLKSEEELPASDIFPRTFLMLNLQQMIIESFPLPFMAEFEGARDISSYKMSKSKYKDVTINSPMFAIDCEMCNTAEEAQVLTKVCIVNEDLEVIYETLVKPKSKITNYLTQYSGVTKEMLENVETTLEDVQKHIKKIIPKDAILIGHSLNSDLHALKLMHPYVMDTSIIFNLSGRRGVKSKLAHLSEHFLNELIQQNHGHCPKEDAVTAMKLVKLKLLKGYHFGDSLVEKDKNISVPECEIATSIFNHTKKSSKSVGIVGAESTLEGYKEFTLSDSYKINFSEIPEPWSKEGIEKLKEISLNNNLSIGHFDISERVTKRPEKIEKFYKKIDKWCESIYNNVSLNGMTMVLFSTSKTQYKHNSRNLISSNSSGNSDSEESQKKGESSEEEEEESSSKEDPQLENESKSIFKRQSGVCFIKLKTLTR